MKKKILCGIALVAGLWSCTEDYTNWAAPQSNAANEPETFVLTAQPTASSIDFATLTDETIQLFTTNVSEGHTDGYTINVSAADVNTTQTIEADADGKVSTLALEDAIVAMFGKAPTPHTINLAVETIVKDIKTAEGTISALAKATPFSITATLDAPYIDENGYYIVGNIDGWTCKRVDAYHMTNNGGNVYDNPEFSVELEPVDGIETYEIKMIPAADFNDDGSIKSWDRALSALPGADAAVNEGMFSDRNAGGNIKFSAVNGAKKYVVTINAMETSYKVEAISYGPYIYEAGNDNNWGAEEMPLYGPNNDGIYSGCFEVRAADWGIGFKFLTVSGNWDAPNYGAGTCVEGENGKWSGTLAQSNDNLWATPGFYIATVNLADFTFELIPINSVYVVGSAVNNDWDTGVKMDYNATDRSWQCETTLGEGVIKFKGNGTWDTFDGNWGGTMDNIINGSNDNIPVNVTGKVLIKFYPRCDTKSYCTITPAN
jgi:hypothetical protein